MVKASCVQTRCLKGPLGSGWAKMGRRRSLCTASVCQTTLVHRQTQLHLLSFSDTGEMVPERYASVQLFNQ